MAQVAERGRAGRRRLLWAAVVAAIVGIVVVVVWFQPQTLLYDTTVMESLPDVAAPAPVVAEGEQAPGAAPASSATGDATAGGITVLAEGAFADIAHKTTGSAQLVRLADGSHLVRFVGLRTDNGPDLRVYLSAAPADGPPDALDDDFVDLGALKGNVGDQNYEIPADVDVSRFRSVSVWCRRFAVGFGVAPLS